jgi:uncharacterized protein (TIGR02246 family)
VERLVAIQDIRDLIVRYAIHCDDKDWHGFAQLWAEDAVFVANGVAFEGRDTLLEFLTTCLPDDYATAKTDAVWISRDFENRIVGRYDDTFVGQNGRPD